jgi:hypothetical protein
MVQATGTSRIGNWGGRLGGERERVKNGLLREQKGGQNKREGVFTL